MKLYICGVTCIITHNVVLHINMYIVYYAKLLIFVITQNSFKFIILNIIVLISSKQTNKSSNNKELTGELIKYIIHI